MAARKKLSKRAGSYFTLRDLIEEAGRDATRWFLIARKPDSQLTFDIDLARQQSNDNPVFYVQYAHARVCSLLRQAQEKGLVYEQADGQPRPPGRRRFAAADERDLAVPGSGGGTAWRWSRIWWRSTCVNWRTRSTRGITGRRYWWKMPPIATPSDPGLRARQVLANGLDPGRQRPGKM